MIFFNLKGVRAIDNLDIELLVKALVDGDSEKSLELAKKLISLGVSKEDLVIAGIEEAMARLDAKCTLEQFNLLEIMLAGRAVTAVTKYLYPADDNIPRKGTTIVLATLEGDVHDIGKNIVKTILTARGYRVVDCGKNCPMEKLLEITKKEKPLAVGISGLIFTVIPLVKQVKNKLKEVGMQEVRVMAGGAALKQSSKEKLYVDFVAETPFDSVHYLDGIAEGAGKFE